MTIKELLCSVSVAAALSGLVVGTASAQTPLWPLVAEIGWPEILIGAVAYCVLTDGCGAGNPARAGSGGNNSGSELTIPVGSYNQCETDVTANGHPFHALLDSGASGHMTFGKNHAKALGFDPDKLSYSYTFESANGTGHYAKITLREVKIGSWSLRDVPAEITQASQSEPLLGLEILHPLNFHLSKGYCHLQLPQTAVMASLHTSSAPMAKPEPPQSYLAKPDFPSPAKPAASPLRAFYCAQLRRQYGSDDVGECR